MKKHTKLRVLLFSVIMLSLFLISCAVKRKSKEVDKVDKVIEKNLQNDSTASTQVSKSSFDFLNNTSSSESLLSKLGLVFNGASNEDKGKVIIKESDKGLEVDIQGMLNMALDKSHSKEELFSRKEAVALFDSIISAKSEHSKSERSKETIETIKKESEKETTGIQFGAYLTVAGVLCFILALIWLWFYLKR